MRQPPSRSIRAMRLMGEIGEEVDDQRRGKDVRHDPQRQHLAPPAEHREPEDDAVKDQVRHHDMDGERPHAGNVGVEGDVLPEILLVPVDDGEGAPEHLERALHRHPMIGVELLVVGVAMMRKMHVGRKPRPVKERHKL